LKDDLLEEMIAGNQHESLKTIRREIEVVKDSLSLSKIFIRLQDKRAHMAVVIDEYGSLTWGW
jgi:CBS domain containing-hemolysin-like protein